jgi:RNA polymerase sigma-54 factor|tara:strand:+ start:1102 stop:2379 length:1278 start_codon:yes stop_codon:yes gene_type:complete
MAISLLKEFKQKQKVSITPLLKKSIDLLQLSRYELVQKIEKEIEINPFIEMEDSENIIDEDFSFNSNEFDFNIAVTETLRESLINQVNDLKLESKVKNIALILIDSLDESGQLVDEIEDLIPLANFGSNFESIELVLKNIIQNLEPSGIGYRNFKECIRIQIDKRDLPIQTKLLCHKILFDNLSDNIEGIKQDLLKLGENELDINTAIYEIKSCDLSPGLNFKEISYVVPDLKIHFEYDSLQVDFVEKDFPKIKIDEKLISQTALELKKNPNKKLSEKIQDAKWLLSSVRKRNETVESVGELICKKQISFFEENPLKLNPLTSKDLAEELGIHPSTVSRILRSKYIDTPKGIISLKSLLVSSVSKTRNITPLQLMQLIDSIIKKEKVPKSDNKIATELNKRGFNLARRTITKYRKRLSIPSSRNR